MSSIELYLRQYLKSGNMVWFEKIYDCFMPKIFRYFYYRTYNLQTAEDLSGELALRVYNDLRGKKFSETKFFAWIYRIARNLLTDYYRKTGRAAEYQESLQGEYPGQASFINGSPYLARELGINDEKLYNALAKLTGLQRDVIILKFIENFDYEMISMVTGKRKAALRGIVFRGLQSLKKHMEQDNG